MRSNLIPALMPYDPYKDWLLALDFANLVNSPNGKPTFKTPYGIYDKFSSIPGASFSAGEIIFYNPVTGLWNFRTANDDTPTQGVGLDIPEGTTNKCTNYNAAPTDLTNVTKSGDAAATLTVVDDTAALRAAGFGPLIDAGKMNGNVYKLDNSAGVTNTFAIFGGQVGNTNTHTFTLFVRGGTGALAGILSTIAFPPSAAYKRVQQSAVPSGSVNQPSVRADPGQVIYFILNQLEEKAYATNPVIVAGAAATRGAPAPVVTGLASLLTPPFTLVAVANLSAIDGVNRYLATTSAAGSSNDRLRLLRASSNNADITSSRSGVSTSVYTRSGYTGARLIKQAIRVRSLDEMGSIDGSIGSSVSVSPPIGMDRLDLGVANGAASGFLNSPLLFVGIAPDVTDAELQALTA